jgi:alkylhydroperoxidase family enzyme
MNARLNLFDDQVAARFSRHIVSAGRVLADSTLPTATQELVKIRASQINGCGFCVDMHFKDAGDLDAPQPGHGLAGRHGVHRG